MFGTLWAFSIAFLLGAVAGLFFAPKTVGIFGFALFLADLGLMLLSSLVGSKEEYVWYFGIAGMILPIYAALAYGGAQLGSIIRAAYEEKHERNPPDL